jgi:hypothetical protein
MAGIKRLEPAAAAMTVLRELFLHPRNDAGTAKYRASRTRRHELRKFAFSCLPDSLEVGGKFQMEPHYFRQRRSRGVFREDFFSTGSVIGAE